jgi:purine-cytosine permease-like protein
MMGFYVLLGGIVAVVGTIVLLDWLARRKEKSASSR